MLASAAVLLMAAPVAAYWHAGGTGSGSATAATMPTAAQPAGSVSGQSVTLTWAQSTFRSGFLGTFTGGGYSITRYAAAGSTPITPNSACASVISGSAASLQCVEASVPYGAWQYAVTPVLGTFTGTTGSRSATITVAPAAPVLSASAQNPATGQSNGDVNLSWGAVTGATGYNLYRRASAGAYNFASPVNGATPLTATSYADAGSGLTGGGTYDYVVRAVAGSPGVESVSSNESAATVIARPAAPPGAVTATAMAGAQIDVTWSAVSGVAGYNVYRRTSAGSYNFASPLNGGTVFTGTTYHDTTGANGTSYLYTVRSVITGAAGAQVESTGSAESSAATADSTAPAAPSAVTITSGGSVKSGTSCGVTSGTRYINAAGQASVSVTATIATPEAGETVVFSATTPGSTPVTPSPVAAGSTSVTTSLNLSSLLDGTVTLTAATRDAAGNVSATAGPANVVIKDVVGAALSNVTYNNAALPLLADSMSGTSECGAAISATETSPHNGNTYSMTISSGSTFSLTIDALSLTSYSYNVTATDLAGNPSAIFVLSGTLLL